jgi:hypothetical protein
MKYAVPDAMHEEASDVAVECSAKGRAAEELLELLSCTRRRLDARS